MTPTADANAPVRPSHAPAAWINGEPANDQAAMADALEWLDYLRSIEHTCIKSAVNRERLARCIADLKKRTGAE